MRSHPRLEHVADHQVRSADHRAALPLHDWCPTDATVEKPIDVIRRAV
jgi:hypothetical protein